MNFKILALHLSFFSSLVFANLDSRYVINIDNPTFRKLVSAVPTLDIEGTKNPTLEKLAKDGQDHLTFLLTFTGLFSVMNPDAYGKPQGLTQSHVPGFEDVDLLYWKTISAESLTLGKLIQEKQSIRVEFRTADIPKMKRIVGMSFSIKDSSDLYEASKTYVDKLLEEYTGRPGIFSTKILLVGREKKESHKQIYTCDIDGKNLRQLTTSPVPHLSPSWGPDGKKILFTSYDGGKPDLYMMELDSKKITRLANDKGINSGGVFSPNSQLIAYTASSAAGDAEIYTTRAHLGEKVRVPLSQGHTIDVDPTFSPDGKMLAFASGRFGNPHIFVAQLEWTRGDSAVRITSDKRLTFAGWFNTTPAWAPNGQKLAFAGYDREIDRFDLFLVNPDGTELERLTLNSGDNENPNWSANGQLIIFHSNRVGQSNQRGINKIYLMNKDGSEQRPIPIPLYDAQTPKWGPYSPKG